VAWNKALEATRQHPVVGAWFEVITTQLKATLDQPLTQQLGATLEDSKAGTTAREALTETISKETKDATRLIKRALFSRTVGHLTASTLFRHVPLGIAVGLGSFSLNKMLMQPQNPVTQWFKELLPQQSPVNWPAPTVNYVAMPQPAEPSPQPQPTQADASAFGLG